MRKHDKVPATSGQVGEIAGAFIGEMKLSKSEAKAIVGNMGTFRKDVRKFWSQYRVDDVELSSDLIRWTGVYERLFGHKPDLSQIVVPEKPKGFGPMRLVVVAREIVEWTNGRPLQGTQDALKKHFPCWQYVDDLDEAIMKNDRDPRSGSYAVWVRDVQEADEEFANRSANDLMAEKHTGITNLECAIFEADYYFETGKHLDVQNVTLCTGSRHRGGYVPLTLWHDRFRVDWAHPSASYSRLHSRRVWA
ncbi:MAG: hypothetical protein ABIF06_01570 [bacterium]